MASSLLRLAPLVLPDGSLGVEVSLDLPGQARRTVTSKLDFAVTDRDQHDLRWYLEDYLQYPQDPAPKIAARIEGRMKDIGAGLFRNVFASNDDVRGLWARIRGRLDETRVEIVTDGHAAATIPWELLRDPENDVPLALGAGSFVRTLQHSGRTDASVLSAGPDGAVVRILLVICRPRGGEDVPFRSVASRIVRGLGDQVPATFQLDVLRPPTFEKLGKTLRQAAAVGKPYHIVHFDGHGTYEDLNTRYAGSPPVNLRGYLWFENPARTEKNEPIHGEQLGELLAETDVPLLVLNACRSAHAEPAQAPPKEDATSDPELQAETRDLQSFGSLAQEVIAAGATLRYLPPYSPDLNPIELVFSKVKQLLRTLGTRTREALWNTMQSVLDQVTPSDAINCFRHAGYMLCVD